MHAFGFASGGSTRFRTLFMDASVHTKRAFTRALDVLKLCEQTPTYTLALTITSELKPMPSRTVACLLNCIRDLDFGNKTYEQACIALRSFNPILRCVSWYDPGCGYPRHTEQALVKAIRQPLNLKRARSSGGGDASPMTDHEELEIIDGEPCLLCVSPFGRKHL